MSEACGERSTVPRPVRVPWCRTDMESHPRSNLHLYASFLRGACPSNQSRMADTCSMLETWGEENGQHGSRPNVAARAVMVSPPAPTFPIWPLGCWYGLP